MNTLGIAIVRHTRKGRATCWTCGRDHRVRRVYVAVTADGKLVGLVCRRCLPSELLADVEARDVLTAQERA